MTYTYFLAFNAVCGASVRRVTKTKASNMSKSASISDADRFDAMLRAYEPEHTSTCGDLRLRGGNTNAFPPAPEKRAL